MTILIGKRPRRTFCGDEKFPIHQVVDAVDWVMK